MYAYYVCGLSIASEVALPGLIAIVPGDEPPDVTIRRDSVPTGLENAIGSGPNWQIAGNSVLLRVPGVVRFLLRSGNDIVFEAEGGGSAEDIAIFLVGAAFAVLLHQRRQIVLRASAVRVGDKAVLFCGPSGTGKSTIAAALGQRGYRLLADDICVIAQDKAGAPIAHSEGSRLNLWTDAILHLDLAGRRGSAVRPKLDKFYVEPHGVCTEPLQLSAVYALRETRPPFDDGISHPNVIDTTLLIHKGAYHPRMVAAMGQKTSYFLSAAKISARVGVFYLTRPRDFACLATVIDRLEEHWRMIGLVGTPS